MKTRIINHANGIGGGSSNDRSIDAQGSYTTG